MVLTMVMEKSEIKRGRGKMQNYKKPIILLLSAVAVSGFSPAANGANWRVKPSIEVMETYSDNVNLDASSRQGDFVTQVTPGILITGSGSRLNTSLSYAPVYLFYPGDSIDKHDFRQNLEASLTSELISETLFIEGSANINQRFLDRRQAISSVQADRTNNRRTVQTYQFSPYLVHAFGTWATAQLKYDLRHIRIASSTQVTTPDTSFGNSLSHQGTFSVTSGTRFRRLGWTLSAQYLSEQRELTGNYKDTTLRADFSYQLTHMLSLLGSAGYENRDSVGGSFANFKGFIWDAGFRLVPGPRTSLSFRYGNQFNGSTFSGSAQYKITAKDSINFNYTDSIQTFQSFAFNSNNIVNLDPSQNSGFISGDLTRRKSASLSLGGTRGRTTYSASAFFNKYRSDNAALDEKRYGAAVSLSRQLSRKFSISGSFSYNLSRFSSDNIDDKFWSAAANVNYTISKSLVGTLGYVHSDRSRARIGNLNGGSNYISLSIRAAI